ncbi:hypothetical protein GCM10009786_18440 [Leucobacter alluvii]|uniref:Secreted protein n=1 Tax=Leucobacter alluvii TaxID=340321 RepID=A0ABP5N1A2_9MICO
MQRPPRAAASAAATVLLPAPETPITTSTRPASCEPAAMSAEVRSVRFSVPRDVLHLCAGFRNGTDLGFGEQRGFGEADTADPVSRSLNPSP